MQRLSSLEKVLPTFLDLDGLVLYSSVFSLCVGKKEFLKVVSSFVRGHVKRVAGGWQSRRACIEVKFAEYHKLRSIDA